MANLSRPLSPHLSIYRWQISNSLSILHRLTGLVLTAAFVLLCIWLIAAATGREAYGWVEGLLHGPVGVVLLAGLGFSLFFHLLNGVRHLFWDVGKGFDKLTARRTGRVVVAVAVLMAAGFAAWVLA